AEAKTGRSNAGCIAGGGSIGLEQTNGRTQHVRVPAVGPSLVVVPIANIVVGRLKPFLTENQCLAGAVGDFCKRNLLVETCYERTARLHGQIAANDHAPKTGPASGADTVFRYHVRDVDGHRGSAPKFFCETAARIDL